MRGPERGREGGLEEGVQKRVQKEVQKWFQKRGSRFLSTALSVGSILNLQFDIFGYVYTKLFSCLQWKIHYTHILKFLLHHCSDGKL